METSGLLFLDQKELDCASGAGGGTSGAGSGCSCGVNETFEFGGMCLLLFHNFDKLPEGSKIREEGFPLTHG